MTEIADAASSMGSCTLAKFVFVFSFFFKFPLVRADLSCSCDYVLRTETLPTHFPHFVFLLFLIACLIREISLLKFRSKVYL